MMHRVNYNGFEMESESAWEWRAIDKRVSVEADYLNTQINANRVDMGSVHVTPAMAMAEIEGVEWITKMPEEDSGDVLFGAAIQAYDPNQKRGEAGTPQGGRWVKDGGSGSSDADYLAAVEAGDTAKQQAMVDDAAKAAGYDSPKVYHGTRSYNDSDTFPFSVFNKGRLHKKAIWFSEKPQGAEPYAGAIGTVGKFYLKGWKQEGSELGAKKYIVKSPNQIKSADPVTYDSDGNVIPLSQRFNDKDDRITFSNAKP